MKINPKNLEKLSPTELVWFNMMRAKAGTVYVQGPPGGGKTAILVSIGEKLNLYYVDMRLSQKDEAEVGNLPALSEDKRTFHYAVPEWAVFANTPNLSLDIMPNWTEGIPEDKKYVRGIDKYDNPIAGGGYDGTLIIFEELNRANLYVRNAGLQLLQERKIGEKFKFKDHVYMAATGNLGEEDGTEVEEFDTALNNRLIHIQHNLEIDEWIEQYAKEHVHPIIVGYIKSKPGEFFKMAKENLSAYATPRSWTHLSKFITTMYGKDAKIKEFIGDLTHYGICYVGGSINGLLRYCEDMQSINIGDILTRYEQVEHEVKKFTRARISELLVNLRELDAGKFDKKGVANLIKFFEEIPDDEKIPYLKWVFKEHVSGDKVKDKKKNVYKLLQEYRDVIVKIDMHNK